MKFYVNHIVSEDEQRDASEEEQLRPVIRLCALSDLIYGEALRVELDGGHGIALYQLNDGVFATDDWCTHSEAPLSDGEIVDGKIICPYHEGRFDIRTGDATGAPCSVALRTYPVIIRDGEVFITL